MKTGKSSEAQLANQKIPVRIFGKEEEILCAFQNPPFLVCAGLGWIS